MGLLDDAIREHLDLKRRSGGDPTEIARLEHEALGPVRREPEDADAPAETAPEAAERHAEAEPDEPEPAHEPTLAPPPPAPVDPRESDIVHQPTTEFHVEDHHDEEHEEPEQHEEPDPEPQAAAEPHADEDVLEETPDFLQETPEHDRLWFEQRPPRDFDFDD